MSALRLSEVLPCERRMLEVVHSYARQRLSGNISDPIVSNKISGNATFYRKFLPPKFSTLAPRLSSPISEFPKQLFAIATSKSPIPRLPRQSRYPRLFLLRSISFPYPSPSPIPSLLIPVRVLFLLLSFPIWQPWP